MTNLILTAALKGTIVLGAAWIATALLRRRSADLRHRIWLAALIAMALLLVPVSVPQTMRMTIDASAAAPGTVSVAARSIPSLRDRLVCHRSIAVAAVGRRSLAAVSHHSAVARGGSSPGERRHPNSHDLGRDPAGDSGARLRRGLARRAARRGDPA